MLFVYITHVRNLNSIVSFSTAEEQKKKLAETKTSKLIFNGIIYKFHKIPITFTKIPVYKIIYILSK